MRQSLLFILIIRCATLVGQTGWNWETLAPLPDSVSNNAVTYGKDDLNEYVFSFGGIDASKIHAGIHKRAFRYTISTNSWEELAPLPFSVSNIASSASTVQNKIYIIGGYHVNPDGSEISSNEVVRYDPASNTYLPNGADIPIPIDDHVHAVWRDSLIYIITGWSNTGNVPNVQIYNPALDSWMVGSAVPNTNDYKVFGGAGVIINDTIYYCGGASMGADFPARNELRKGVINPTNPSEISWTLLEEAPNTLYRSAALFHGDLLFWVGGSAVSYNYNGIAYNGSGGVDPLAQLMRFNTANAEWNATETALYGLMDLRGIAQISPAQWIICGGMQAEQRVSDQTYLLEYDPLVGGITTQNNKTPSITVLNKKIILSETAQAVELTDLSGKKHIILPLTNPELPENLSGFFVLRVVFEDGEMASKKIFIP